MSDRPNVPTDASEPPDPEITAALRSMVPPPHGYAFWADLDDRLAAEAGQPAPTMAVPVVSEAERTPPPPPPPPEPPLAEVVPLPGPRRARAHRWMAAAAAVLVVALGATAIFRPTSSTDVNTTAASTVPELPESPVPSSIVAAPPGPSTSATSTSTGATTVTTVPAIVPPTTAASVPPTRATGPTTTITPPALLILTPEGLGPLRLGMTIDEVKATGMVGNFEDPSGNGTCGFGYPTGTYWKGDFQALFLNGRLARFLVDHGSRLRTPQGVTVASPSAQLSDVPGTRSYGQHTFDSWLSVVDILSGDVGYRFLYDDLVRVWIAGTKEALERPREACL